MNNSLIERTRGIKTIIGDELWSIWEKLCMKICLDGELRFCLQKPKPRNNEWGMNQKMVCNMLGLFLTTKQLHNKISGINEAISKKNMRSYISNHQAYGSSPCALTREQHERIKQMLQEL